MAACDLPRAWQGQHAWRILDTDFGDGSRLLALWQTWARDTQAPRSAACRCDLRRWRPIRHACCARWRRSPALRRPCRRTGAPVVRIAAGISSTGTARWPTAADAVHRPCSRHAARTAVRGRFGLSLASRPGIRADAAAAPASQWDKHSDQGRDPVVPPRHRLLVWHRRSAGASEVCCARPASAGTHRPSAIVAGLPVRSRTGRCATTRSQWRRAPGRIGQCVVVGAGLAGAAWRYALARSRLAGHGAGRRHRPRRPARPRCRSACWRRRSRATTTCARACPAPASG